MRTFLFGALALKRNGLAFDADEAFVAAALHDLGLLPAFASPAQSFEVDGADAASAPPMPMSSGRASHCTTFALPSRAAPARRQCWLPWALAAMSMARI
jgi:hypothetical protein